jgi:hypothetical protein
MMRLLTDEEIMACPAGETIYNEDGRTVNIRASRLNREWEIAKAQAEISDEEGYNRGYKDGIREVVEWVESHTYQDTKNTGFYSNPKYGRNFSYESWQQWQAFKKEKGIEEVLPEKKEGA